jgi:hypothetical protein
MTCSLFSRSLYYSLFISLCFRSLRPTFGASLCPSLNLKCPSNPLISVLIHVGLHPFIQPTVHLSIHPFTHPIIHSFIDPPFLSFIHSYPFINLFVNQPSLSLFVRKPERRFPGQHSEMVSRGTERVMEGKRDSRRTLEPQQ